MAIEAVEVVQDSEVTASQHVQITPRSSVAVTSGAKSLLVHPNGSFLTFWLALITSCVLYNFWTLVLREAFPELQTGDRFYCWIAIDSFTDLVFFADIFVQLRTCYMEKGPVSAPAGLVPAPTLVIDGPKLAKHYINSKNFGLDVLALTPLDLAQFYFGPHPLFRMPRFIKVYRAWSLYRKIGRYCGKDCARIWKLVNVGQVYILCDHWLACTYHVISEHQRMQGPWVYTALGDTELGTIGRKYLAALHWATGTITLSGTSGNGSGGTGLLPPAAGGNGVWGQIFTIVWSLIGFFTFAIVVGLITSIIINRRSGNSSSGPTSGPGARPTDLHKSFESLQAEFRRFQGITAREVLTLKRDIAEILRILKANRTQPTNANS